MPSDIAKTGDPLAEFKARVADKLAKDIGEMLPPEALAVMVQQAVEKTFFEDREIHQQYGSPTFEPSWFIYEVAKASKPILQKLVADFVAENEDILKKAVTEFLDEKTLFMMATTTIQMAMRQDFEEMANRVVQVIRNG